MGGVHSKRFFASNSIKETPSKLDKQVWTHEDVSPNGTFRRKRDKKLTFALCLIFKVNEA